MPLPAAHRHGFRAGAPRFGAVCTGYPVPYPEADRLGHSEVRRMIILGLILVVVGYLTSISILITIGVVLLVVGAILAILGATGRAVGGRAHWY